MRMVRRLIKCHFALRCKITGASAVEYALIIALIAGVIFISVALLGTNLGDLFDYIAEKFNGMVPS